MSIILYTHIYIHSNIIIKEFTFGTKKTWPYKTDDLVKKISYGIFSLQKRWPHKSNLSI